jgi:hypothetical protein
MPFGTKKEKIYTLLWSMEEVGAESISKVTVAQDSVNIEKIRL